MSMEQKMEWCINHRMSCFINFSLDSANSDFQVGTETVSHEGYKITFVC